MDERKRNEDWTNVLKKGKNENGTHERFDKRVYETIQSRKKFHQRMTRDTFLSISKKETRVRKKRDPWHFYWNWEK